MLLHLLRHADAGDPAAWEGPDAARPISDKGRKQSKRLGEHLVRIDFQADVFITSPKVRAAETAEIVAAHLKVKVAEDARLAGPFEIDDLEALLRDAGDPERVVLVGHDPDFSEVLSDMCGPQLMMRKGALARVEIARPLRSGAGELRWLIPPDALKDR
jgi:phosphohistidine phosphatase